MSLILEALKKLEREKRAPDRGFLVVSQPAWPAASARAWRMTAGLLLMAALGAAVATALLWPRREGTGARTQPAGSGLQVSPPAVLPPVPSPAPPASLARSLHVPQPGPAAPPVPPLATAGPPPDAPQPRPAAVPLPSPAATPELQLQAISEREGEPVAVVSGRLVRAGDSFDGVRVLRIGAAEVEVEVRGQRRVLRF